VTEFTIPAPELARLTHNALAFMPARSAVKVCRVNLDFDGLSIMATDLFTVGEDYAPVGAELEFSHSVDLSRESLQELDRAARGKKKEDLHIRMVHQDGLSVQDDNGAWMPFLDASAQRDPEDLWDLCEEMLSRPTPDHLCLIDPKFMSAFGKIKASGGAETIADLSIADSSSPISVRIGNTFRGAIMPVDRSEAAESEDIGTDGLWPES
jgi:hypothetical protein